VKLMPLLVIALGLLEPALAADAGDIEYEIVDGKIVVFGHTLVPRKTLPDFAGCKECESTLYMRFVFSPDNRRILIVSDILRENFDAWVFDTQSGAVPVRIADERRGTHAGRPVWHSDNVIELPFAGMGYSTSIFIEVSNPSDAREIDGPLLYDADRDVYVNYEYNFDKKEHQVEVGTLFTDHREVERFPIALDIEYRSDSRHMIESVEIDGPNLIVTYNTTASGMVRDVFKPKVLEQ